ncbi:MAG: RagB/SusD family nutrient uptake outer membrane protein [Tannerellaceae bacterium]|nr:RagB/SusD family nutrient uptake outer membrane protein [Tannerellaceae bacterium]
MKKIYFICFLTLTVFLSSCADYLERYPLDGPASDTYFTDESDLLTGIYGIYKINSYRPVDNIPLQLVLDNLTDIGYDRNTGDFHQISSGNHDVNNSFVKDIWEKSYQVIARCNFMLDNMHRAEDAVPAATYKALQGEARFVRAFTYHYLIELYGGVPLVTHMLSLDDAQMPRSSKKEVFDFIIKELDEIVNDLPDKQGGTGRAGKSAVYTLKSRTALYNGEYDMAAEAALKAMSLNVHSLDSNYGELFRYAGEGSQEIIWSHQFLQSADFTHSTPICFVSRNGQGYSNKVPSQTLVDAYQCIDGKDIDKSDLYDPENPFENRDPRLGYTLAVPGSVFFGFQFETHRDSLECWNYNTDPPTRIENQDGVNAYASFTGYCWRKYVDEADWGMTANSQINLTIMRYAEVLLNYAEAKIEANQIDPSVYDAINQVRQRASVDMPPLPTGLTQAELRSAVRKERLYELACEGFRLFDIRRWKIAEQVMDGPFYGRVQRGYLTSAPTIDENGIPNYSHVANRSEMRIVQERIFNAKDGRDYLWPIPELEVSANAMIEQNPGW